MSSNVIVTLKYNAEVNQLCRDIKHKLSKLNPQPEAGSAVLSPKHLKANVPLDADGECRAAVLGGKKL